MPVSLRSSTETESRAAWKCMLWKMRFLPMSWSAVKMGTSVSTLERVVRPYSSSLRMAPTVMRLLEKPERLSAIFWDTGIAMGAGLTMR